MLAIGCPLYRLRLSHPIGLPDAFDVQGSQHDSFSASESQAGTWAKSSRQLIGHIEHNRDWPEDLVSQTHFSDH